MCLYSPAVYNYHVCLRTLSMDDLPDRVNLSVTLLLTFFALKFSVAEDLPKLGYLTYIDKKLLCCFFYVVSITISHGCIQHPEMLVSF